MHSGWPALGGRRMQAEMVLMNKVMTGWHPDRHCSWRGCLVAEASLKRPGSARGGSLRLYHNPAARQTLAHPRASRQATIAVYNFMGQRMLSSAAMARTKETAAALGATQRPLLSGVYRRAGVAVGEECVGVG